jgi:hypothetical protein
VTIEAKHDGPRGNTLIVDAYFVSSTGAEVRITASSTSMSGRGAEPRSSMGPEVSGMPTS